MGVFIVVKDLIERRTGCRVYGVMCGVEGCEGGGGKREGDREGVSALLCITGEPPHSTHPENTVLVQGPTHPQ